MRVYFLMSFVFAFFAIQSLQAQSLDDNVESIVLENPTFEGTAFCGFGARGACTLSGYSIVDYESIKSIRVTSTKCKGIDAFGKLSTSQWEDLLVSVRCLRPKQ